ncbi:MAG: NAD(P)-dependent oxidoreductase [Rhodospirillaceae bacterium]|jgi:3-hydroxyisobutyrate dehydrogenase-like beta-hydroxyacid dehydrogenase|nr:NAD(P)-dependent oxidoreductase [Rhodospirillaceae bacterium]MBT6118245.1 NAD(P)-dependent oxidoreductase [Rhodospirillaceae bacterium]
MADEKIGLVGYGTVGREIARHLIKAHGALSVVDSDLARGEEMRAAGATPVEDLAALAADCDAIVLSLPGPPAVRAVLDGPSGIIANANPGLLIVDTTSSDPATGTEMARRAKARGIAYVEAPISTPCPGVTGPDTIRQGDGTFIVGASEEDFPRAEALLRPMARYIYHIGPVGRGSAMKLVTNYVAGATRIALAEGIAIAAAMGIPATRTMEVCGNAAAASQTLDEVVARRTGDDPDGVGFAVDLRYKDFRLANELGRSLGVPMPLGGPIVELYQMMLAKGWAKRDINSIVPFIAEMAGVDIDRPESRWPEAQ